MRPIALSYFLIRLHADCRTVILRLQEDLRALQRLLHEFSLEFRTLPQPHVRVFLHATSGPSCNRRRHFDSLAIIDNCLLLRYHESVWS